MIFTLLYYGNNGVIRFAAVLGAAVGMAVYAVTVGRFFVRAGYLVIDRTVGRLLRMIRKIIGLFIRLFHKIRLTCIGNRLKIKVHKHKKARVGKGETTDGTKAGKRKTDKSAKAKNPGVSPRQE